MRHKPAQYITALIMGILTVAVIMPFGIYGINLVCGIRYRTEPNANITWLTVFPFLFRVIFRYVSVVWTFIALVWVAFETSTMKIPL